MIGSKAYVFVLLFTFVKIAIVSRIKNFKKKILVYIYFCSFFLIFTLLPLTFILVALQKHIITQKSIKLKAKLSYTTVLTYKILKVLSNFVLFTKYNGFIMLCICVKL